jgi:thymidylate synthase
MQPWRRKQLTILDHAYHSLADNVLRHGYKRPSRVGDTISLPGLSLQTSFTAVEFPILTTRKIYTHGVIGELAAFLQGATKLQQFKDFGCPYWDHNAGQWAPNKDVPVEHQTVGKIYGAQWRSWGRTGLDQLQVLIDGLKTDTYGRRHILTTWNPEELDSGCLPPCHLLAQFYVQNKTLDCVIYMRSVDIALGLPSDLVLYGVLLMLVANEVGMSSGRLHFQFGDAHIYEAHVSGMREQLSRRGSDFLPRGVLRKDVSLFDFKPEQFMLQNYQPLEAIKYVLL